MTIRKCLKCDSNFQSLSISNRLCNHCRNENTLDVPEIKDETVCGGCMKVNQGEFFDYAGLRVCRSCWDDLYKWAHL